MPEEETDDIYKEVNEHDESFKLLNSLPKREPHETMRQWSRRVLEIEEPVRRVDMDYFGQEAVKEQIDPFLDRYEAFPNTLILGMPGMGKTRLAKWIANIREQPFLEVLCPVNPDDLPYEGIVLLDEAHGQRKPEFLFERMGMDTMTVIAATTRPEMLDAAFKSRFLLQLHLTRYDRKAMVEMAQSILPMNDESADLYASASAGNPRQLERILEVAKELGYEDHEGVLRACRITADGLTEYHLRLLEALQRAGRPVGLSTLASMLYSDEQSVREHEQLLIDEGLLDLRSNGRTLSREGKKVVKRLEQTP